MLRELRVANLVLIREASLQLAPGLNVLTGETGAGKTIVAQAVSLLLGGKADVALVGPAGTEAYVEAAFANVPPELLPDGIAGLVPEGEDELVIARRVGADGRSRALVFGRSCARADLEALGAGLLEIVSQHEARRLARPAVQLDLLDGAADASESRARMATSHAAHLAAARELETVTESRGERERELEALRRLVEDADELALAVGEEDELRAERDRLRHLDRLVESAAAAADRVNPEEGAGALSLAGDATHALEGAAELDPGLAAPLADLQEAVTRLREAGVELRRYLQELEAQPGRLDQVELRLGQLAELERRHAVASGDELARRADEARALLESLGPADQEEARLRLEAEAATREMVAAASTLHALRRAAAEPFARAVESHLADLGMEHATLEVRLADREPGPRGGDDVELFLQANPGLSAMPIARTASGGELSRIALAVRLAARDRSARPTLVFDEVDAGVGGRTARALGEKLLRLSEHTQLVCITHLPQIAALAERHFRVVKAAGEPSETRIDELTGDAVIEELVRMLGADVGDPDARALATSLRGG
ncbi:MAG: repair protein RecN [Gaiellales bacterium]|nr:repair protein RecN [Gaiellales bacterium]